MKARAQGCSAVALTPDRARKEGAAQRVLMSWLKPGPDTAIRKHRLRACATRGVRGDVSAQGSRDGAGERLLFFRENRAEIQDKGVVFDACDYGRAIAGEAETLFELRCGIFLAAQGDEMRGKLLIGSGTAADNGASSDNAHFGLLRKLRLQGIYKNIRPPL